MTMTTTQHFDPVVIGGGQAGLAMGYFLMEQDRDFVIVDACERVADTWRDRWDSLRLFTQAQYSSLPGMSFPAPDDYYPTKDEMAEYLEAYAVRFDLPVQLDTKVDTLTRNGDRYVLEAGSRHFTADQVVVAIGHAPNVPAFATDLDQSITQLHSSEYRNPSQLPDDDILVVGAGSSGASIAVELAATDRCIWLSGRDTRYIPIGIFNSRVFWWLADTVLTVDTFIGRTVKERVRGRGTPRIRHASKDIRRAGVKRVSRMEGVVDGKPRLEDDGQILGVAAVVWATGVRPDFSWIEAPTLSFDDEGAPIHHRGEVDGELGLYVLGLPFQYSVVSADIGGVGADARYIADHIQTEADSDAAALQSLVTDFTMGYRVGQKY